MLASPPSRRKVRGASASGRASFTRREGAVVVVALLAAVGLVVAAEASGQDPESLARGLLAGEEARAAAAGLAAWDELRSGDELFATGTRLEWDTAALPSADGAQALATGPAETPDDRAWDALVEEARFLSADDPDEALALLEEASGKTADAGRRAALALERLRIGLGHVDAAGSLADWRALVTAGEVATVEDGVDVRLLGTLAVHASLEDAAIPEVARTIADAWATGALALPAPDPTEVARAIRSQEAPTPSSPSALRAALRARFLGTVGSALDVERVAALDAREARDRARALVPAPPVDPGADAAGLRWLATVPVPTDADPLLVFGRAVGDASNARLEGTCIPRSAFAPLLEERSALRTDTRDGVRLDLAPRLSARGKSGVVDLPGTPFSLVAAHGDPQALVARVTSGARRLRIALFALALGVLGAGWAAARMLARSRALVEARTTFVANVSHELRTPLATILLMAENLESGRVTDAGRRERYHASIRAEAARLRRLVEDVLDLARVERGAPLELARAQVRLAPFAEELRVVLEGRAAHLGGTLAFRAEGLPEVALLDAEAFTRAAANLVENALRHGRATDDPDPPHADVTWGRDADEALRLVVRDRGPGVDAALAASLFEPFVQAGDERHAGTGLGLAIVREIARAHGGTARLLARERGWGASFELSVPARANEEPSEATAGDPPERLDRARPARDLDPLGGAS